MQSFAPAPSAAVQSHATALLNRLRAGDGDAARELLPLLYDELRAVAGGQFRGQRRDHTLQPTVLVHEAFMRLVDKPADQWKNRAHFFAVAATAMRQILVNHARARNALKRGGQEGGERLHLDAVAADAGRVDGPAGMGIEVLALNEALEKLAEVDPRKHRVVELRFFGGLTVEEIAEVLTVSKTTVEGEWRAARAWLATAIGS